MAEDPARFIHKDKSLVDLLELLRASGKRVYLATNSLWDYTNVRTRAHPPLIIIMIIIMIVIYIYAALSE